MVTLLLSLGETANSIRPQSPVKEVEQPIPNFQDQFKDRLKKIGSGPSNYSFDVASPLKEIAVEKPSWQEQLKTKKRVDNMNEVHSEPQGIYYFIL